MCTTCGCSDGATTRIDGMPLNAHDHHHDHGHDHGHGHHHHHDHHHDHDHHHHDHHGLDHHHTHDHGHHHEHAPHSHGAGEIVTLERRILAKNEALAGANREWLTARHIFALNLLSSPGAGKTTLLESSIRALAGEFPLQVVEGDQATENDAERIRAAGAEAVQINTGTGCHLEADMLAQALQRLAPVDGTLLFIENVGNLVCPALFDLGEQKRVVILSVTEGDDKPLKYPHMFASADLMIINKIDLLPYVNFDVERCVDAARQIKPTIETLCLSATSGEGMDVWLGWLRAAATTTGALPSICHK